MKISGKIVDVLKGTVAAGTIETRHGIIASIAAETGKPDAFIIPGFIDAHVHIESSMLTPSEFARLAVRHGTVASVSDPHEIANVLGVEGIRYMIENARQTPFTFCFGVPSCVPATPFETSGARIGVSETEDLLKEASIGYLSEMMNFPGVVNNDPEILAKIALAKRYGKPVDGHAPGLRGVDLKKYAAAGIETDHECVELDEALEKIGLGIKILIREGSAIKNFEALYSLVDRYPDRCMFCSDDKHPDDLLRGHVDELVRRSVAKGIDVMKVLRCACVNPVHHYRLGTGLLGVGHRADFIVVDNLIEFNVLKTVIGGKIVAENGVSHLSRRSASAPNHFQAREKMPADFHVSPKGNQIRVIEVIEDQAITGCFLSPPLRDRGNVISDPDHDILKIAVVNRYEDKPPAVAFIRNFGLKIGAIASSVAHDSHNIIAVGTSDEAICRAVNLIIGEKGGVSLVSNQLEEVLPLSAAGIMSADDGFVVARKYAHLGETAKSLGTKLRSPYMTLSFMALLVIPSLKLSDKGLFDGDTFNFVDLFV